MRLVLDILIVLMLLTILGGVVYHNYQVREDEHQKELARSETHRLQRQIHLQAALAGVEQNTVGNPQTIDPAWFIGDLPRNPVLDENRPWVEVARESQRDLDHPRDLIASDPDAASFWYNPYTGMVRARVPSGISDAEALELYNYINETELSTLFEE